MVFDNFFNLIFGWAVDVGPIPGIAIISFILTLLVTVVYKWTTDQELMKSLKEEMKEFQKEMKRFKEDPKKMMELQGKAMEKNMKYFMHSLKPMIITLVPLLIIFSWLRSTYEGVSLLFGWSWIWSYIIFSVIFSFILRKLFKVH